MTPAKHASCQKRHGKKPQNLHFGAGRIEAICHADPLQGRKMSRTGERAGSMAAWDLPPTVGAGNATCSHVNNAPRGGRRPARPPSESVTIRILVGIERKKP